MERESLPLSGEYRQSWNENVIERRGKPNGKGTRLTWHVTAVQGRQPMNVPRAQSERETPHTPQAILIPDHGTTPIKRNIERRTHADDFVDGFAVEGSISLSAFPLSAERVMSKARGNM
jgi:hypothetical protein